MGGERNYSREEKRRSWSRSRDERRRRSKDRRRSRSSSEEVKVKAEKNADSGGIEWRSKDGGLSGGTRQKPLQVDVKEEPASPVREEKDEESIVVRHRIDSPSPPRRSKRGGSSPSPVKEPARRSRGGEEQEEREKDMRRMRVEKAATGRSGARLYSQSPSPPRQEVAAREESRRGR